MAIVSQMLEIVESLAPSYLRFENDKIGLQVGSLRPTVDKVLITLEVTDEVVREAKNKGVQLIISHHPLIFRSLDRVVADDHVGGLVTGLVQSGISLIAAHTNLDRAKDGVSDALAHALDLRDIEVMLPAYDVRMYKIAVFVPKANVGKMIQALGNVGAGIIGNYSHCTFRTEGVGTFYPMLGATPYLGKAGELNEVDEVRLEVLVTPDKIDNVIRAMIDAHPYEEVAYDIYEVKNPPAGFGFGRVGNMAKPKKLRECASLWSGVLGSRLKVSGDWEAVVGRVAVCGGSGADLMRAAKASRADVYVTGDIKYHAAHDARAIGLALIDAGHAETERLVVPEIAAKIQEIAKESGIKVTVLESEIRTNPWNSEWE